MHSGETVVTIVTIRRRQMLIGCASDRERFSFCKKTNKGEGMSYQLFA
jgi:hypothetical protein